MNFATLPILTHGLSFFDIYYFSLTFLAGFICYFFIRPQINPCKYPTEKKIADYGGIAYMVGGTLLFFIAKIFS